MVSRWSLRTDVPCMLVVISNEPDENMIITGSINSDGTLVSGLPVFDENVSQMCLMCL